MRFIRTAVAILCFASMSCVSDKTQDDGKPLAIATTSIIADIVKNVGGEFVRVESLMSAGIDPHQYKASEGDVIRLANASIIFHNGLGLEGKLGDVLARAQDAIPSYAVSEHIPPDRLLKVSGHSYDPHIWFDPSLWIYAVKRVADALVSLDGANALYYRKNEETYIRELMDLDREIRQRLQQVPPAMRILVTSHDAFSYFGRAYGWEVVGIQGVNTSSETSVYTIQNLAKKIAALNVQCIFTETSVSSRSANALMASVSALGGSIRKGGALYSDSLGAPGSGADTYTTMLSANVETIITGISKNE